MESIIEFKDGVNQGTGVKDGKILTVEVNRD